MRHETCCARRAQTDGDRPSLGVILNGGLRPIDIGWDEVFGVLGAFAIDGDVSTAATWFQQNYERLR